MAIPAFAPLRAAFERWLFRIGPVEAAPIVLGQRRIFVLPTAAGFAYAAALAAMLLASINYNVSLGYAFVFLLGGTAVASIVHAFRNLLGLSLRPGRMEPVFAGEPAWLAFLVHNDRGERRPALRLKGGTRDADFDLAAGETREVPLPYATAHRGWLTAGRVVVETRYPLGLIRAWSILVPGARCLVYPRPESPAPPLPAGDGERAEGRPAHSGDDDFAGFRAHRPSDSPRHVAWKTVARGGPMLTKEFAGQDGGTLSLDWRALPPQLGTEARLSRLTAWVLAADAAGLRYALVLPDRADRADAGPQHRAACLQRLALFGQEAPRDA